MNGLGQGVRSLPAAQKVRWDWEVGAWGGEKEWGQGGHVGKEIQGGGDGERARGRQSSVVCIPWVPFNSVNVPAWRQEVSSIIKLIEMRGWVRNLKAFYRGKKVELCWGRSGAEATAWRA